MNTEQLRNNWKDICEHVLTYDSVDRSQATAFLSRLEPQAMSEGFLMLTADNDFIRNWIERHYSNVIQQALEDIYGMPYTLAIEVDPNQIVPDNRVVPQPDQQTSLANTTSTQEYSDTNSPSENVSGYASATAANTVGLPYNDGSAIIDADPSTNNEDSNALLMPTSSLTFENFIIGASNQMAYSMALAVAEEPGHSMLNPLFIYGKSGLGKTHLMRAIQNHVANTYKGVETVYVDSADFLTEYVEATITHDKEKLSFKNFKNNYQGADILLIDDIQYLQGKEQTLDIVFQIFNYMIDQGKQVVLSADRAPKNIDMDERYQSRFNSGGTFDIQPPEVETKLGIIKSFVEEYCSTNDGEPFSLPESIERYIAENSSSNIRELKSAVTKVIYAMKTANDREFTVEDVSRLLENHFSGGAMKKLSITDIQQQVEEYYDVSHSDLIGQKRVRKIAYARQIAIYLCREMLDLPYNYIAQCFGGRDHTTIMYSVTNIEEKLKTNRDLAEEIEIIKRRIREM